VQVLFLGFAKSQKPKAKSQEPRAKSQKPRAAFILPFLRPYVNEKQGPGTSKPVDGAAPGCLQQSHCLHYSLEYHSSNIRAKAVTSAAGEQVGSE
jgi:hypothetical protein